MTYTLDEWMQALEDCDANGWDDIDIPPIQEALVEAYTHVDRDDNAVHACVLAAFKHHNINEIDTLQFAEVVGMYNTSRIDDGWGDVIQEWLDDHCGGRNEIPMEWLNDQGLSEVKKMAVGDSLYVDSADSDNGFGDHISVYWFDMKESA
jgi:hypothetical protein